MKKLNEAISAARMLSSPDRKLLINRHQRDYLKLEMPCGILQGQV